METNTKTEILVDQLLKLLEQANSPEIKTLVTHRFADDDSWLCVWMAKKFIPKTANATIVFVNAGEQFPNSNGDTSVLHFDTGGGEYDQHGKGFKRTSSALLMADKLGFLKKYSGIKPLVDMATDADNIKKPQTLTDLHYLIRGWPHKFNSNGNIDWQKVQERVFESFDIIFGQETQRIESRKALQEYAEKTILPNGLKITTILWHPELREAAFEDGAAIVIWTAARGNKRYYTGIQRNIGYPELYLDRTVAELRRVENGVRGLNLPAQDLLAKGRIGPWFIYDNLSLILNGSRKWVLLDNEYTKLAPRQIVGIVHGTLSKIPREVVSRWKN